MGDEILFEFEGTELVTAMELRRIQGLGRVTVAFNTAEGQRRMRFDNPDPLAEVFPIVDAQQVWGYLPAPQPGERARIKVEYYSDQFHEFCADAVLDLDPTGYDTHPDIPIAALTSE